ARARHAGHGRRQGGRRNAQRRRRPGARAAAAGASRGRPALRRESPQTAPAGLGQSLDIRTTAWESPMGCARLRDLGITVGQLPPGPFNAITDVAGVRVGHATVIHDTPSIARTGVTAIWPGGDDTWQRAVFAGYHSFNGNGEMTGTIWIEEQGLLASPFCITNTHSV